MKKQTKKPVTKRKKLLMIIAIAAGVVVVGITVVIVNNLQARRAQVVRLERASEGLQELYGELLSELNIDQSTASFWKRCGQASAKFNSGTITCGPRAKFLQAASYDTVKNEHTAEILVRKEGIFTDITVDDFNSDGETLTLINFTNKVVDIGCFLYFSEREGGLTAYTLGCNEVVSNFLPGYNRE